MVKVPDAPEKGERWRSRQARPLVWRLLGLCAVILLPAHLFIAVLLTQYAQTARQQFERSGIDNARDLAEIMDRDVASLTAVLQTLSYSTRLSGREFADFHRLALRVGTAAGAAVVLSEPDGQQVVNTGVPFGTPLPKVSASFAAVVSKRVPMVIDLFPGPHPLAWRYSVSVPVVHEASQAVTHVLSFSIDPVRLRDLLLKSGLDPGAVAGIIDRNGRLVARSTGRARLTGTRPSAFLAPVSQRPEGQFRHMRHDGTETLTSFTRMKSTGWIVAHSFPVEAIDAPTRGLVRQLVALGLLTTLMAVVGGLVLSRRILGALSSLERAASAVGQGVEVAPVRTAVLEIDRVGERLAAASHDLRITREVKETLLYEVNHRVKNSLAVVTSLLSLQMRQTTDAALKGSLDDLRARIDVIASVHQRLYVSGRHDRLDLGLFLCEISTDMALALDSARYRFTSTCDEGIVIGVDRTTPMALIVGELLTNAVKHGCNLPYGNISLAVRRIGEGRTMVVIADDGPGLPTDFGQPGASGVGFRIVAGLVRQIRGQITTNAGQAGARFEIVLTEAIE